MPITIPDLVRGMRRREAMLPALLLLVAGSGAYLFLAIAEEMAEGELGRFDEYVLLLFRNPADISDPLGPQWLQEAALEVTAIGGYPLIVLTVTAVVGLLIVTRRYGPALYTAVSIAAGSLASYGLKLYYERPRPDLVEHLDPVHTASFPSGHAVVTTVAYLTLAALVIRFFADWQVRIYVLAVAIVVALLVGISRIYLGVHWPSDVAAGWAVGVAWASLSWLAVSALQFYRLWKRGPADGR